MQMYTCQSCAHWERHEEPDAYGVCTDVDSEDGVNYHGVYTNDDPSGVAYMTKPNFGCVRWADAKEPAKTEAD